MRITPESDCVSDVKLNLIETSCLETFDDKDFWLLIVSVDDSLLISTHNSLDAPP